MKCVKWNLLANFLGKSGKGLILVLFTPLYIRFLGIEGYGLIGFYYLLLSLSSLFDFGLSILINREISYLSIYKDKKIDMHNLVLTLERISWIVAILIALFLGLVASPTAKYWLNTTSFSLFELKRTLTFMGIAVGTNLPLSLYCGGLIGLNRHLLLNLIFIGYALFRNIVAFFILWKVSATIEIFFVWQALATILQVILIRFYLCRYLPPIKEKPSFDKRLLKRIRFFVLDLTTISIVGLLFINLGRLILSKMLSLEIFGYYSLAAILAESIFRFADPFFATYLPNFSRLIALKSRGRLIEMYHQSSQILAVIIFPVSIFIAIFSYQILSVWIGDPNIASGTYMFLSLLVVGNTLNSLMYLPYALQLSYGWTRLSLFQCIGATLLFAPMLVCGVYLFGPTYALFSWVVVNVGILLVIPQVMHKKIIKWEKRRWYMQSAVYPLLGALIVPLIFYYLGYFSVFSLLVAFTSSLSISVLFTPFPRRWIGSKFKKVISIKTTS